MRPTRTISPTRKKGTHKQNTTAPTARNVVICSGSYFCSHPVPVSVLVSVSVPVPIPVPVPVPVFSHVPVTALSFECSFFVLVSV